MDALITAYISIICASGVLNLILFVYAFLKRHTYSSISKIFNAYTLTIVIYCFSSATGLLATNLQQAKILTVVQYIGIAGFPALGLLFVLKYLGFNTSRKIVAAILAIPTITILMVATNDFHHLHYRVYELDPILGAPFIYQVEGFWYMIHGTFSFGYMFIAAILAASKWKETNKVYRPQLITLIVGQSVPIIVIFLYLIDVTPRGVDPLPMALWITSTVYLWCIKSSKLFAMMPVAKNTIFNNINDGVLVLDDSKQLIEYNQAFQKMFPQLNKRLLGTEFHKLWNELTSTAFPYKFNQLPITEELSIGAGDEKRIYHIRISNLVLKKNSEGFLIIFTDITELKELQYQLEYQAFHDELTKIFNRRAFFQKSEMQYEVSMKNMIPYTMILIDIDHFKHVNDTYGHHVGDEVILHVVEACKKLLPNDALFARYGGEEFVIALNKWNESAAMKLAEDLCEKVAAQYCITAVANIAVTISIGVAEGSNNSNQTLHQLLNQADQALYEAKYNGRNQAVAYKSSKLVNKNEINI